MAAVLDEIRAALPATGRGTYLNAGSVGPLARAAADAMREQVGKALDEGQIRPAALEEWLGSFDAARAGWADVLRTAPERIALTHSVTGAMNLAVGGLTFRPGDEVVTTDAEHPGVDEPLDTAARRHGIVVRRAAVGGGEDALAAVQAELSPRTRLIAVSHVLWTTGRVLPVARLAALAHEHGALCLVDGAQSAGAIPVAVEELGVDLYGAPGQKWLCGPVGTGALYVRTGLEDQLEIAQPSYFTRDRKSEGAPFWAGARRFDGASASTATLLGIAAAIRWRREEVGWDEGFERAAALTALARRRLADVDGVEPVESGGEHATLVAMRVAGGDPQPVYEALAERGIWVRFIPGTGLLRASIGFWNDEGDVERLAEGLAELAG